MYTRKSLAGLSLLEFLLSAALSVSILVVLYSVFLGSMRNVSRQKNLLSLQEDATRAVFYLKSAILKNAYLSCSKWGDEFPAALSGGDETITVRHASLSNAFLLRISQAIFLWISPGLNIKPGECIIVSDCTHAELAKVVHTDNFFIELQSPLKYVYTHTTEIRKLEVNTFYLQPHTAFKTLYRQTIQGERIALIDHSPYAVSP